MQDDESILSDPNVWGPPLWDLMFTLAFHVPQTHVVVIIDLFAHLEKVLPCQTCRRSYAIFRKQLAPLTTLRVTNTKAAEWLWSIHDMVNQKLGKPAILYDKLELKHKCMTCIAHPMSALDILRIMARTVKARYVVDFGNTLVRAAGACPGMERFAAAFAGKILSADCLHDTLFEAHNELRPMYGMQIISRDAFDSM